MFDYNKSMIKSHTLDDLIKNIPEEEIYFLNLVIDLDNTIIYAKIFNSSDIIKIKIIEYLYSDYYLGKFCIDDKYYLIFIRPYFNYFINTISIYYNIFIYTNSNKKYCLNVIQLIENKFKNFKVKKVIYREINNCLIKSLGFLCDNFDDLHFLDNIPNYDYFIKKTIIIDDSIDVWKFDQKNLINIEKFIIGKDNYDNFNINLNSISNYDMFDNYNFLFFNKNCMKDDILLILSNRLFVMYNLYMERFKLDSNYNIQDLISKYKL